MLIIPLTEKISWKNPPFITISLIFLNVIIFFGFQLNDLEYSCSEYGFTPSAHRTFTLFSHMFLHGGPGHLIGNMIFLWISGCLVEAGSRRSYYIAAYILSGLSAVALFWVMNLNSARPLVGASGAISGLMGIVTTLYGMKKIKVFFSFGFYFNYLRTPAIILLPIWIGKELWAYFYGGPSSTAYMAHVGGFIGGAALGYLNIKVFKLINNDALVEKKKSRTPEYLEQAMACSGRLEFDRAMDILEKAYKEAPRETIILEQMFKTVRVEPESEKFHVTTRKILGLLCKRQSDYPLAHKIYTEYAALAVKPKLSAALYVKLCAVFAVLGHTDRTEKILHIILKRKPDIKQIPDAILKLAFAFKKKNDVDKFKYYKKILCVKYPESNEAENIKQLS